MKFECFLFSIAVNNMSVAKYAKNGKVMLRIEGGAAHGAIFFDSENEYEEWLDNVVSDDDAFYNTARALWNVINAIKD